MKKTEIRLAKRDGFHIRVADFAKLKKVLETKFSEHVNSHTKPKPEELLAEAKNKKSPIHDLFEWNDTRAAHAYRRNQAVEYLRCVGYAEFEIKSERQIRPAVPWKIAERGRNHRVENYTDFELSRDEPDKIELILEQAIKDFRSWFARYKRHQEFLDVFDPIMAQFEEIVERLEKEEVEVC